MEGMPGRATLGIQELFEEYREFREYVDELADTGRTLDRLQEPVSVKALPASGAFHDASA